MTDLLDRDAAPAEPASRPGAPQGADATTALPEARSAQIESAAAAALALAVSSAEKAARGSPPAGTDARTVPTAGRGAEGLRRPSPSRYAASAAAVLLALAGGWFGAQIVTAAPREQPWAEAAGALRRNQEDVIRLTGDVKALKVAVEALKDSVERSRSEAAAKQAQLADRLEREDRAPQEATAKIEQLTRQLDRIEAGTKEPSTKLAALAERLDRIERQVTAATASADPKPAAVPAGSVPLPPPAPLAASSSDGPEKAKDVPVEGWVLHQVYDGVALIEGRNRRLFEVGPGEMVPGIGRVETIEKRGKRWVVVTAKGIIGTVR